MIIGVVVNHHENLSNVTQADVLYMFAGFLLTLCMYQQKLSIFDEFRKRLNNKLTNWAFNVSSQLNNIYNKGLLVFRHFIFYVEMLNNIPQ